MSVVERKIKKSQLPYEISTASIGDIMRAKAAGGDKDAKKVVRSLMGRRDHNAKRGRNVRSS